MTAGGLKISYSNDGLMIEKEGKIQKFVKSVEQVSFSALSSLEVDQEVLYITEHAVFMLTKDSLELIEIAPGIDLGLQIIGVMGFKPITSDVKIMPKEIFSPGD